MAGKKSSLLERRLEQSLPFLFGGNLLLVVIAVLCVTIPISDRNEDLCTHWGENKTSPRLHSRVDEIIHQEVAKPQIHYLGWRDYLDPDAKVKKESRQKEQRAHFTSCFPCPPDPTESGFSSFDTLCWNESSLWSFQNGPLVYKDGRISVQIAGYYFIYSRLLFNVSKASSEWSCLTHDMMKESPNVARPTEKLLENKHVITRPGDTFPSYLGAVVYLHSEESIYVRVQKQSQEYLSNKDSYIGMFSLW